MAKVKVKLLTSRAGVRSVSYPDVREQQDEEGNFVFDDEGAHVMEEFVREQYEGWAQSVGDEIEVDPEEAARLIEDGQAEPIKASSARKPRRPKGERAEKPNSSESR